MYLILEFLAHSSACTWTSHEYHQDRTGYNSGSFSEWNQARDGCGFGQEDNSKNRTIFPRFGAIDQWRTSSSKSSKGTIQEYHGDADNYGSSSTMLNNYAQYCYLYINHEDSIRKNSWFPKMMTETLKREKVGSRRFLR